MNGRFLQSENVDVICTGTKLGCSRLGQEKGMLYNNSSAKLNGA